MSNITTTDNKMPPVIQELIDVADNCQKINFDKPSTLQTCFNGINKFSCDDIKESIKAFKGQGVPTIDDWKKYVNSFNENKDIIDNGGETISKTFDKVKCILNNLNDQILKDSDVKFDVSEIDNVKNKMIEELGGVSNKKYMITLILLIIMILVVGGLLFKMFYKRK